MDAAENLFATLNHAGWQVTRRGHAEALLPDQIRNRYARLPVDVEWFLRDLEVCVNGNETVWFLTHRDYGRKSDGGFHWNEHELLLLDAAGGDEEQRTQFRSYWDHHFPFLFAVHSDYDYLAVDLNPDTFGQIVHGYMPEADQPGLVSASFSEFLLMFTESFRNNPAYPLSLFH